MIKCSQCNKDVIPNTKRMGTQTEARCPKCGTFIKWLGKTDVKRVESLNANNLTKPSVSASSEYWLQHISNQLQVIIELIREK